jgi:hypothetical protein
VNERKSAQIELFQPHEKNMKKRNTAIMILWRKVSDSLSRPVFLYGQVTGMHQSHGDASLRLSNFKARA